MLFRLVIVIVLAVFTSNLLMHRPVMESLLFAAALAVGMSPELLPAIVSITLSRGAQVLARSGVLVRRLTSIENLGAMDVLCADKTGTLTSGKTTLHETLDPAGVPSQKIMHLVFLNAWFETGIKNPLESKIHWIRLLLPRVKSRT
jgi:P-type Mg2+ transporter